MRIGVCTLHLRLLESNSLKGKRRIIKSIKDRVRSKFNVSIAEIGAQDKWQWATLGIACVSNDVAFTNSVLSKIVDFVNEMHTAELVDYEIEIQ
jgi:uncharacterized protein YlxP (DUF503 family)